MVSLISNGNYPSTSSFLITGFNAGKMTTKSFLLGNPRGYYLIDNTGSYSQAGTKYLSLLA
jgi:hypothetical protein